jgi:hypothetical protein
VQRRFTGERVADENHHTIDPFVGSHAGTRKADVVSDGGEDACLAENLSTGSHVSHPRGRRGLGFGRGLDGDSRTRPTGMVSSL